MTGYLTLRSSFTLSLASFFAFLSIVIGACNSAHAERHGGIVGSDTVHSQTPRVAAYSLDILGEDGFPVETYRHRGRIYVLGHASQRYVLQVSNPTARRIEAVVSVDGLDVVDGEPADARKRGYVIQPYGQLRLEGFRVSSDEVAAFRFSSVRHSYAGRKGKARNVGVIGVAIFEERQAPALILPAPEPSPRFGNRFGERRDSRPDADAEADFHTDDKGAAADLPAVPPSSEAVSGGAVNRLPSAVSPGSSRQESVRSRRASRPAAKAEESAGADRGARCCRPRPQERPGLGTAFGERRFSAATFTRFERQRSVRPSAMLELRYNDASGLQALGIQLINRDELSTRETASPFPGDRRFARPPR